MEPAGPNHSRNPSPNRLVNLPDNSGRLLSGECKRSLTHFPFLARKPRHLAGNAGKGPLDGRLVASALLVNDTLRNRV